MSTKAIGSLPDWACFEQAARVGNLIAFAMDIHFDHETPINLVSRFVDEEHVFLLESATAGPGSVARYSFVGFSPLWSMSAVNGECFRQSKDGAKQKMAAANPVEALRTLMQGYRLSWAVAGEQETALQQKRPCPGAVGFFSYDMTHQLEPQV